MKTKPFPEDKQETLIARGFTIIYSCPRKWYCGHYKAQVPSGGRCLHLHRKPDPAWRCAERLARPTPGAGTPQGAYDHAAGYHD